MKVRLFTIDELHKSQVKGFIRYKKGKMEQVSPFSRVGESLTPFKDDYVRFKEPEGLGIGAEAETKMKNLLVAVQKFNTEVKAPYVHTQYSTLGGMGRASIIVTISLQDKKDWTNGILQNSPYTMFHLGSDGRMEQFSGHRLGKFRKTRFKSVEDAIDKINKFIGSHSKESK